MALPSFWSVQSQHNHQAKASIAWNPSVPYSCFTDALPGLEDISSNPGLTSPPQADAVVATAFW